MKKIDKLQWIYKASQIRKLFGYDEDNSIDIEKVLETREEYTLIYRQMSDNISGLCIKDGENKTIVVNSSLSKGRQRFTIAHELCHLYFHENGCYVCAKKISDEKSEQYEKEADLFASYFLAPYSSFRDCYENTYNNTRDKYSSIVIMEHIFGLSHLAVLARLRQEGYITPIEYEFYSQKSPSIASLNMGYTNDLYIPTNVNKTVGKYVRLANELHEKDLISQGKYEELLLNAFRDDLVFGELNYGTVD